MSDDAREDREDEALSLLDTGTESEIRMFLAGLTPQETADLLDTLDAPGRERIFPLLDTSRQASALREMESEPAVESLLANVPDHRLADIVEQVPSDDATDIVESIPEERRERVLDAMEAEERAAVEELQRYAPDTAGGIMQKELLRVRADGTVGEAVETIRREYDPKIGDVYDIYVVDPGGRPLGRVRNRHLLINPPTRPIAEIMVQDVRTVPVDMDQERIAEIVQDYDLVSVAVVDPHGRLVGRILVDDIVDVLEEEATEDIQKLGGSAALGESYLGIRFSGMVLKRAPWLAVLFVGETLTETALTHFQWEIDRATVLALFLPLIISSGGNSGSQASTLVIRAMAVGEVALSDWWRVVRREIATGLALGAILGAIGVARILIWEQAFGSYGEHAHLIAITIGASLVGVALLGTISGSMLPFLLRRMGFDPASASAPFVATLVDVSGLVIYFSIALLVLRGTVL